MSGLFASYTDKAAAAVDRNRAALSRSTARLADHDANRPNVDDADASFSWKRERRDLEDRVESDKEALAFAEAAAAKAQAEAAEREADAAHKAEERRTEADRKLINEIDALARKLAAKRDELTASIERTAAMNAKRGERPFILDAETRVRATPAKTTTAVFEEREKFVDAAGNSPSLYRTDTNGSLVPGDHGVYQKKREMVQFQAERFIPQTMPTRFAESLVLVDLEGKKL